MIHDARLTPAAVGAWAIAALVTQTGSSVGIGVAAAASLCAGVALIVRWYPLVLACLAIAAVSLVAAVRVDGVQTSETTALAESNASATVRVRVITDPRAIDGPFGERVWFWASVTHVTKSPTGEPRATDRVLVTVSADAQTRVGEAAAGQWWTLTARFRPHESTRFAARLDVHEVRGHESSPWWWTWSDPVRSAIGRSAERGPPGGAALVPALVHGDESAQDDWTASAFQTSGLTHLMAVSGTNLTIVLGCVLLVGRAVGVGGRGRILLGALAVAGFVILARPEPSVVRAAVMGSVGVLGLMRSARGGLRALSWAICAMMIYDPWMSTQAGFILSVSATAGILVLVPWWSRLLDLPHPVALAFTVPLAAHLACAPMVAVLSDEVSFVAIYANALATPFVAPATVLGLLAGLARFIADPIGDALGWSAAWSAEVVVVVAHRGAALDGAAIAWNRPWWVLALACVALAAFVPWVFSRRRLAALAACGLVLVVWQPWSIGWPPRDWVMVACDVGQGDATVLNAGDGVAVVVDAGEEPQAVHRCLDRLGVDRVALFVASHAHDDHVGGWEGVGRDRVVDMQAAGPGVEPRPGDVPVLVAHAGMRLVVGDVELDVLAPGPRDTPVPVGRENDESIVLLATVGGMNILLTGDLEQSGQAALLRNADVSADVFLVPHHGSGDHDPRLAAATGAQFAIISVGADNRHGHPHPDLLATLDGARMTTLRTDLDGDIAVTSQNGRPAVVAR